MLYVNESELKRICPNKTNYRWATNHYDESGTVQKISIVRKDDSILIESIVLNGYYNSAKVSITLDLSFSITKYGCSCFFCTQDSACGHVVATLLKINDLNIKSLPFEYQNSPVSEPYNGIGYFEKRMLDLKKNTGDETLDLFKEKIHYDILKVIEDQTYKLQVEVIYDQNENFIYYNLRVGNDKYYVVKNIDKLLLDIKQENNVKYGVKLEFIHAYEMFDESSQKIIDLTKNTYTSNYTNNRYNFIDKNEQLDMFYDQMSSLSNEYINIDFALDKVKIPLEITKQNDYYSIDHGLTNKYISTNKYLYSFIRNTLTRYELDDNHKVVLLIKKINQSNGLYIHQDKIQEFNKIVLQDISEYLKITGIDINEDYNVENSLHLYGDVENDIINLKLEGYYDDGSIENLLINEENQSLDASKVVLIIKEYANSIENGYAYLDVHLSSTQKFIKEILPLLQNYAKIYVSEALKQFNNPKKLSINIGVKVNNNLLEIDMSSLEYQLEDLKEMLKAYKKKKKFHRLKSGDLVMVDNEEIAALDQSLKDLSIDINKSTSKMTLPLYRSFMINDKNNSDELIKYSLDDKFNQMMDNTNKLDLNDMKITKSYDKILREYQVFGIKWMNTLAKYGFGGILADDMGLGKTLQVIALIESTLNKKKASIVITPASLMLNWEDEVKKFSKKLKTLCINGSISDRKQVIEEIDNYDIIITTYDYLRKDINLYDEYEFDYIILDEAQYIKNKNTKTAHAVKQLNGIKRFALSGTPIENSLAELWSIFDFLMPNYLYNYNHFLNTYEKLIVKEKDQTAQAKLKKMVEPFILRRHKKDVILDLPDKIEKTLSFSFNDNEKKLYQAKLVEANTDLQKQIDDNSYNKVLVLKLLTELRQICCEPRLVYEGINTISSKLQGTLELIDNLIENKKKILLFSSFTSVLDLIEIQLKKEGISYCKLTGSTKKEDRKSIVDQFQNDDTSVFLISLKAGGTGLNLTAAQAVIHYDPWWNVSAQNQATDRAYRIGQDKDVSVFKLIMKDSIEEKIIKLQENKASLANSIIENSEGSIASMSIDDIKSLFE